MGIAHATPRIALAAVLAWLCAFPACAHDSWFARLPSNGPGIALGFSTGTRFPLAEIGPPRESVLQSSCVNGEGKSVSLDIGEARAAVLPLRADSDTGAVACSIELIPFDIVLPPPIVKVYFRDVHPSDAVRAAWSAQQANGGAWQERYRKFARVEVSGGSESPEQLRGLRKPVGLDLELVVTGEAPLRVGEMATFQVLSRGEPVADLPLELVSERSPLGVWGRSNAQGRLSFRLPFSGAWLVRGTLIEPDGEHWKSRFVTLAFEAR